MITGLMVSVNYTKYTKNEELLKRDESQDNIHIGND